MMRREGWEVGEVVVVVAEYCELVPIRRAWVGDIIIRLHECASKGAWWNARGNVAPVEIIPRGHHDLSHMRDDVLLI